jgi:ferrous iron transport protein A
VIFFNYKLRLSLILEEGMKMSELQPGDKALITRIDTQGETAQRISDMGLVPGTGFKVLRKAPLGDPMEIQLRGFLLALRLSEADGIDVQKVGRVGDGVPLRFWKGADHGRH